MGSPSVGGDYLEGDLFGTCVIVKIRGTKSTTEVIIFSIGRSVFGSPISLNRSRRMELNREHSMSISQYGNPFIN